MSSWCLNLVAALRQIPQAAADAFLARLDERTEDRDAPVSNETIGAQLTALAKWEQGTSPAGLANVDNPSWS